MEGDLPDPGSDNTKKDDLEEKKAPPPSAPASSAPTHTCADRVKNGDETDVDCGGSCGPCAEGRSCKAGADCTGKSCVAGLCCVNTKKTVTATTGPISGTKQICCPPGGTLVAAKDCGDGHNHSARAVDATCGEAHEGSGNGGSACVEITCSMPTCGAGSDAGSP